MRTFVANDTEMEKILRIKEVIKEHGLTIGEVANRMGIHRITLSTHINGNPSVEVLSRIAAAVGCKVTDLFIQQPDNDSEKGMAITCPHCGRKINITVEAKPEG